MLKIIMTAVVSFAAGFILAKNINSNPPVVDNQILIPKEVKITTSHADKNENELIKSPDKMVKSKHSHFNNKKRLFNDEKGAEIELLLNEKLEKGEVQSESQAPNKGKYTKEKLSDGTIINREYDSEDKLIGESQKYDNREINKSFFDSGQTKGTKM